MRVLGHAPASLQPGSIQPLTGVTTSGICIMQPGQACMNAKPCRNSTKATTQITEVLRLCFLSDLRLMSIEAFTSRQEDLQHGSDQARTSIEIYGRSSTGAAWDAQELMRKSLQHRTQLLSSPWAVSVLLWSQNSNAAREGTSCRLNTGSMFVGLATPGVSMTHSRVEASSVLNRLLPQCCMGYSHPNKVSGCEA